MKPLSFCDARRKQFRSPRSDFHCTSCGEQLPQKKRDWGLVWENNIQGICAECLKNIRAQIGFKFGEFTDDP
jgi:hypothetical protein